MIKSLLPSVLWALLILGLTLMPGKYLPETSLADFFKIDKVVHIAIFLGFVYLLIRGLKQSFTSWTYKSIILFSLFTGILYGALIEFIQQFIPDRSFEYLDMFANTVGCGIGAIVFKFKNR